MGEVEEFEFEGVVVSLKTKGDLVIAFAGLNCLRWEAIVDNI